MRRPKIAIYMSCYNHENYVAEAVNSILNQSYENWELFVVDDGSQDRSGEILESFRDERIHYYHFKKNTKFIGASNFLQNLIYDLEVDYITILASDDMWKIDKLKKQIEILEAHPEYKSCFTWDEIIFDNEKDFYQNREEYSHVKNRSRYDWIEELFLRGNCLNACSMLMCKDTFYELGRMNENYIQLGDLRLWLKLVCQYPFYLIEEPLTYYRRHQTNLSTPSYITDLRSVQEDYKILGEIIRELDDVSFKRAFYIKIPYIISNSEEAVWAAKFFMMAGLNQNQCKQVAVDLYYEHCENEVFTSLLENNYYFGPREFIEFSGQSGLQLCFLTDEIKKEFFQIDDNEVQFYPSEVLLKTLDGGGVNKESIGWFSYVTMLDLFHSIGQNETGLGQLNRIMSYIKELRLQRYRAKGSRNIFFFIAQGSVFDVEKFIDEIDLMKTDAYGVSYIPTSQSFFNEDKMPEQISFANSRISYINLINEKEKCLYFLDELGLEADVIYYVDCLLPEYECLKMVAGYSLGVELNQITKVENQKYSIPVRSGGEGIINEVITYIR